MGLPINEPRVPEPHAEVSIEDEKLLSDLYIRTSWFDAALALDQIEKVSIVCTYQKHKIPVKIPYGHSYCCLVETMNY